MAINPFNFPGVTLTQEFVAPQTGNTTVLSAACIGRPYYLHRAEVTSEAATTEVTYNSSEGNSNINLPERTKIGEDNGSPVYAPLDASDTAWKYQKLLVRNGVFNHVSRTSGVTVASVTAATATDAATVTLNCGIIVKSGYNYTANEVFGNREAALGDTVKIKVGSTNYTGTISGISRSSTSTGLDRIKVTLASGAIAEGATIAQLDFLVVTDAVWKGTAEGTYFSVNAGTGKFNIEDGLTTNLDGVHDDTPLLGGSTYTFAIQYREYNDSFVGKLGSVSYADNVEHVLGAAELANPLALAVKLACLAAPGTTVYFTGVAEESVLAFRDALDFLNKYDNIYSIVPLTADTAIINQLIDDIIDVSSDEESKVRHTLWYGLQPDEVTGSGWSGADNNYDRVDVIKGVKNSIQATFRAQAVWADGALYNGEEIPNYILAAAPAGMRSYEPCHRPLSNLGYDFLSVDEPHGYNRQQLKEIGAEGIWIIANNIDGNYAINKRQVTTAASNNINQDEESIVANTDEIALSLCHVGETRVGCSNISPTMIMALSDDITIQMDSRLINRSGSVYIGAQLLSWTLDDIYQDPVNLARIYAVISCTPPKPFNEFKLTLRVI